MANSVTRYHIYDNTIASNDFGGLKRGIEVQGINNSIYDNEIFGSAQSEGIALFGINNKVYGNNIYNLNNYGIWINFANNM